jgi:hypothetical protein
MDDPVKYPYGGGGGGHTGTGKKPLYTRVTPEELARACSMIRTRSYSQYAALALSCKAVFTDSAVDRSMKAGREAAERLDNEDIDESALTDKEAAALRFFAAINAANAYAEHLMLRQAHCDTGVVISRDADTQGPNGEVIKGKVHYADPKGAAQAWARLQLSSRFRLPKHEEDAVEASVKDEPPTREELLSDLRTLIQTDPDLIAEAGLSVR